jgi:manganese/zinc/iron transport system permease protein
MSDAFWIIGTGFLVAASCGVLGCFLLLKKVTMIGDAISHSVLPGIVIAVMLAGSLSSIWVFLGAGIAGFSTVLIIDFLKKKFKVQNDASLGLTFTFLFALGVVLISFYAGNVHIDQECVLYGEITFLPLSESLVVNGADVGPKTFYTLLANFTLIILVVSIFFKELKVSSFDPGFSSLIGVSPNTFQLILLGLVSFTTVASFEAVGSILVVAFLVSSPLAAYQISPTLKQMLLWTLFFGLISSTFGFLLAERINSSISASMALVSGIIFAVVFITKGLILQKWNPFWQKEVV